MTDKKIILVSVINNKLKTIDYEISFGELVSSKRDELTEANLPHLF